MPHMILIFSHKVAASKKYLKQKVVNNARCLPGITAMT